MLARLQHHSSMPTRTMLERHSHVLFVLPRSKQISRDWPAGEVLDSLLKRRRMKLKELAATPVAASLEGGALAAWVMLDAAKSEFEIQASMRAALQLLLCENPAELAIIPLGAATDRERAASAGLYSAWVNGAALPERKRKPARKPLKTIHLYGSANADFAAVRARAEGNTLCRELTVVPPNELTPRLYRARIRKLAQENGWKIREYDYAKLKKMGAGAFCAVAQGSADDDAAIVHLTVRHARAKKTIALIGKGICFDTGGHNLKPARYMYSMHEDMNGSAVSLGLMLALARASSPVNIDCWLALAQNHISPNAYKPNDVVTALNGTTIEVTHTDAEGRMVLADTLTLASRAKPHLMIAFATLTGSMHVALGARYSGVFATSEALAVQATAAGKRSGERICTFPMDADYDSALDSTIADIKQCTLDGDADHILATRFLSRFVGPTPWLHVDLSASNCKGGLGAIATDVTGFGVGWGLALIESWLRTASASS